MIRKGFKDDTPLSKFKLGLEKLTQKHPPQSFLLNKRTPGNCFHFNSFQNKVKVHQLFPYRVMSYITSCE